MAITNFNLTSSCISLSQGRDAIAGVGRTWQFTVGGTWAAGDKFTITNIETLSGTVTAFGEGIATGIVPTFSLTYKNKLNLLADAVWSFSNLDAPTDFNNLALINNGFIELSNYFGSTSKLYAAAVYQGKLALFSRGSTQVWQTDADAANYQQMQVLDNVGTFAPLSVKSLGDSDVLFLSDSGVRSLRVRDSSNNATTVDIGSAVDDVIKPAVLALADVTKPCAVVEPTSNRYWLAIGSKIYVLSYFASTGVVAWSTYDASAAIDYANIFRMTVTGAGISDFNGTYFYVDASGYAKRLDWTGTEADRPVMDIVGSFPSYTARLTRLGDVADASKNKYETSGAFPITGSQVWTLAVGGNGVAPAPTSAVSSATQVAFKPIKFAYFNGVLFCRDSDGFLWEYDTDIYSTNRYDNCVASVETAWIGLKNPATGKKGTGMDVVLSGAWNVKASMDTAAATPVFDLVYSGSNVTYGLGSIPFSAYATHYKLRAETSGSTAAKLSTLLFHMEEGVEK